MHKQIIIMLCLGAHRIERNEKVDVKRRQQTLDIRSIVS